MSVSFQNLIKCYRLIVPIHTAHVIDFVTESSLVQFLRYRELKFSFIGEMRMPMKVNRLMPMPIIQRDEVVTENAAAYCPIFHCDVDVAIVFNIDKCRLCLGVMKEAVMISFDKNNLPIETFNQNVGVAVSRFPNHIAKDIYHVVLADLRIPPAYKLSIHFFNRCERSVIKVDYILVTKVKVTRKKHFTQNLTCLFLPNFATALYFCLRLNSLCAKGL